MLAGLLFLVYLLVIVTLSARTVGFDAFAYWSVDLREPYRLSAGAFGAFPYFAGHRVLTEQARAGRRTNWLSGRTALGGPSSRPISSTAALQLAAALTS